MYSTNVITITIIILITLSKTAPKLTLLFSTVLIIICLLRPTGSTRVHNTYEIHSYVKIQTSGTETILSSNNRNYNIVLQSPAARSEIMLTSTKA